MSVEDHGKQESEGEIGGDQEPNAAKQIGGSHGGGSWFEGERVSSTLALDEGRPLGIGFGEVAGRIAVEVVAYGLAVLQEQSVIEDLEGIDVDLDQLSPGDTISTVSAESGLVAVGRGVEGGLTLCGMEKVSSASEVTEELWFALDRCPDGEEGDRVMALKGDALFVEVEQSAGSSLGIAGEGEACPGRGQNQKWESAEWIHTPVSD